MQLRLGLAHGNFSCYLNLIKIEFQNLFRARSRFWASVG